MRRTCGLRTGFEVISDKKHLKKILGEKAEEENIWFSKTEIENA